MFHHCHYYFNPIFACSYFELNETLQSHYLIQTSAMPISSEDCSVENATLNAVFLS